MLWRATKKNYNLVSLYILYNNDDKRLNGNSFFQKAKTNNWFSKQYLFLLHTQLVYGIAFVTSGIHSYCNSNENLLLGFFQPADRLQIAILLYKRMVVRAVAIVHLQHISLDSVVRIRLALFTNHFWLGVRISLRRVLLLQPKLWHWTKPLLLFSVTWRVHIIKIEPENPEPSSHDGAVSRPRRASSFFSVSLGLADPFFVFFR